ncbi:hypothetical protein [Mycobacteroides abscessus]|uniref:hypothetical protein n=2 Tax=Mycobacteroides abscessus TaxID=36809 RepID=UPI0009AB24B8|nr:hypothetical protein [Mycobacteroides abscessus]
MSINVTTALVKPLSLVLLSLFTGTALVGDLRGVTMNKRIVPGQWVLSDDEVTALTTHMEYGGMFRSSAAVADTRALRLAIGSVNQKRLGDPPDVVRRRADGALATRCQDATGGLYWDAPVKDQSEVDESWQVIFPTGMYGGGDPSELWRSMAFESDFTNQEAV